MKTVKRKQMKLISNKFHLTQYINTEKSLGADIFGHEVFRILCGSAPRARLVLTSRVCLRLLHWTVQLRGAKPGVGTPKSERAERSSPSGTRHRQRQDRPLPGGLPPALSLQTRAFPSQQEKLTSRPACKPRRRHQDALRFVWTPTVGNQTTVLAL